MTGGAATLGAGPGWEEIGALLALAVATTWTPGPNNALLSASGARYGLRATLPHAAGVWIGFPMMVFAVALGLGEAFQRSELLRETLRWGGAALLAWLAMKLATSRGAAKADGRARPWGFLQAAAFQWVNPKAWVMSVGVAAPFVGGAQDGAPMRDALIAAACFMLAGVTSCHAWAAFGAGMGRWLGEGVRLRAFNLVMAALLLLGVFALLTEDLTEGL